MPGQVSKKAQGTGHSSTQMWRQRQTLYFNLRAAHKLNPPAARAPSRRPTVKRDEDGRPTREGKGEQAYIPRGERAAAGPTKWASAVVRRIRLRSLPSELATELEQMLARHMPAVDDCSVFGRRSFGKLALREGASEMENNGEGS